MHTAVPAPAAARPRNSVGETVRMRPMIVSYLTCASRVQESVAMGVDSPSTSRVDHSVVIYGDPAIISIYCYLVETKPPPIDNHNGHY